jgi:hypothetical protein
MARVEEFEDTKGVFMVIRYFRKESLALHLISIFLLH